MFIPKSQEIYFFITTAKKKKKTDIFQKMSEFCDFIVLYLNISFKIEDSGVF
jgi:hypothetical protein